MTVLQTRAAAIQSETSDAHVILDAPPTVPARPPRNVLTLVMPLLMIAGTVGFLVISGGGTSSLLMGGLMLVSLIGMLVNAVARQGRSPGLADTDRLAYLRRLRDARGAIDATARAQRSALLCVHPEPVLLAELLHVNGSRSSALREQGVVRIGTGLGPMGAPPRSAEPAAADPDPLCSAAQQRLLRSRRSVEGIPILLDLFPLAGVMLSGGDARDVARALIIQLCAAHKPDDLRVALVRDHRLAGQWEWVKWLPHNEHPLHRDLAGPLRMIADSLAVIRPWPLAADPDTTERAASRHPLGAGPHLVVVLDGGQTLDRRDLLTTHGGTVTTIVIGRGDDLTDGADLVVECEVGRVGRSGRTGIEWWGTSDRIGREHAEAAARGLAGRRQAWHSTDDNRSGGTSLTELLGLGATTQFDPLTAWRRRSAAQRLQVPLGTGIDGAPVVLDLKETAHGGMGPHGLVIGATGSGKSEVLRTVVMGLAARHTPAELNVVLIDFKGGATFLGLQPLPQVAAVITNLADDAVLVDRMRDALSGELHRRQELLRSAGNFASVAAYEAARSRGAELDPLPALLIVCDEFTELLTQRADFAELFVAVGRLGRSLGVHLLLASQRIDEGRMRGLDSHLSYRIGLKTFSAAESRALLDSSAAYELPPTPGAGYLKFGTGPLTRFDAAYVSGPLRPAETAATVAVLDRPEIFSTVAPPVPTSPAPAASGPSVTTTDCDELVARMSGRGPAAHQVWLPPLDASPALGDLVTDSRSGGGGVTREPLQVPVGVVDRPYEQRRDVLWADLTGAGGHAIVVGGPRSGKSNLLRCIAIGLAMRASPTELHCYGIDLGGGGMVSLIGLPHVGDVATRNQPEVLRRMLAELSAMLSDRERDVGHAGLESWRALRAARLADAGSPGRPVTEAPDVFLLIDGWGAFRSEFVELEAPVLALVQRGLSYGIHVVLSATRWADVRPAMRDLMLTRFELRLGDPGESEIDRRSAATVPQRKPGRGLTAERLHYLTATPTARADTADDEPLVDRIRWSWPVGGAPRIRLLPAVLPVTDLPSFLEDGRRHDIPIGVDETTLCPVYLDLRIDPHLLILGDSGSGKTSFLRALIAQTMDRYGSAEARFLVIDYRRTLLESVPDPYLAGYAGTAAAANELIAEAVTLLTGRLPGPAVAAAQLRRRDWWSGPELFVLVDDYDLVQVASGNPLVRLVDLLSQARDIGLHLVVCRRAGGASRALHEPVLQRLRELGTPGVLLSGPGDEGVLLGTQRPTALPPGRGVLISRQHGQQLIQLAHQGE